MVSTTRMDGKTVLVTGATSGIGKETAVALAGMGASVVITARDAQRGATSADEIARRSGGAKVDVQLCDMASLADIRVMAARFLASHDRLDVLVNNAGAYNASRSVTKDGFETTFGVNHLAYFLLTELLLDRLKASAPARIVNVSSAAHSRAQMDFDDLQASRSYSGMRIYGQSKLANVLFTYELARRLEGTGVTANALHPGVVATGFAKNNGGVVGALVSVFHVVGKPFLLTPQKGAATTTYLASSPEVEGVTGKYFAKSKETASNDASHDIAAAKRLWEISEQLVGERTGVTV